MDDVRNSMEGEPILARWSAPLRALHWVTAGLLVAQVTLGLLADAASTRSQFDGIIEPHAQIGVLILGLVLLRLIWRFAKPEPASIDTHVGRRTAAATVHGALYVLLFLISVTGMLAWTYMGRTLTFLGASIHPPFLTLSPDDETGRTIVAYAHEYGAWTLMALVAVHIMAALWHERTHGRFLRRMI